MKLYDLVIAAVQDAAEKLTVDDYFNGITAALNRYSTANPRVMVRDIAGTDSNDLALPAEWIAGFSTLRALEYPIGTIPADLLQSHCWSLYQAPSSCVIRLADLQPTSAESVRCTFTVLHSEETLPAVDQQAVAELAASACLYQLSAAYGNSMDNTIQADSVDYQSKTDQYRRLAAELRKQALAALGLDGDDAIPPASVVAAPPQRRRRWGR